MPAIKLPLGTDVLVELQGLKTQSSNAEQNAASVNMTLYNSAGSQVGGQSWPTPLTPVGSGGNYAGLLTDGVSLVRGSQYRLEIIADAGANLRRVWNIPCHAVFDDGDE